MKPPHESSPVPGRGATTAADIRHPHYQKIKGRIHQELLNRLNLERLARVRRDQAEPEIRSLIQTLLEAETQTTPLSLYERESMTVDVLDELFGLGPIEALLKDPSISDILVNRYNQVFVERDGRLERTEFRFIDDDHVPRTHSSVQPSRRAISSSSTTPKREVTPKMVANMLAGGAAVAAGGAVLMNKPHDHSGPRDSYFMSMQAALTGAGIAWPTLVIDKTRLSENIRTLKTHLPPGMGYRIVAKSLPSIELISHIRDLSGTDRLMTFNQPMLSKLSVDMPEASQLLGKPLPVRAARHYFETLPATSTTAADNVEWLIDRPARLQQYASLASDIGRPLKLVLELDVGLHRGGFTPGRTEKHNPCACPAP